MPVTAFDERRFYDAVYESFLQRPPADLRIDQEVMRRTLNDPAQAAYERRRLYLRVLEILLNMPLCGMRVLDYGCGPADWGVLMATEGADVTLLDLSPAAIELGMRRAEASGVTVRGEARDASDLSCFASCCFDLVFASAALHHTLKYPGALEELSRVLRPGGVLLLAETYGNNRLLNAARRLRAWLSREAEEQGEEIVLGEVEIALLRRHFREVQLEEMQLLAMGKRLLRGQFHRRWARAVVDGLERMDGLLLSGFPWLRRYCGEVVIRAIR